MPGCCPVVEVRQHTLHPGGRNALIELFEREFIDSQEASGIGVVGQFRDLDDPERFVWLRGFQSLEARGAALAAFYGGPVWEAHRGAANATWRFMGDPARPARSPLPGRPRPAAYLPSPGGPLTATRRGRRLASSCTTRPEGAARGCTAASGARGGKAPPWAGASK